MIHVCVRGVPPWVDAHRLLGPGAFALQADAHVGALAPRVAADLVARVRNLTIGGSPVHVDLSSPLPRALVRAARTEEARRMRDRTPGFLHPHARTDDEGRLGLTPEALALAHARSYAPCRVVDATAGCGGDAIAFARAGHEVVAFEPNADRRDMLRHNATLYGVGDRVDVRAGDAMEAVWMTGDLLFVDPPWTDLRLLDAIRTPLARWQTTVLKLPAATDPGGWPDCKPHAVFGEAGGDARRVKFLRLVLRHPHAAHP